MSTNDYSLCDLTEKKVANQNAIHSCTNYVDIKLAVMLSPWLNQKIMTVKGELIKKLAKQFDVFALSHGCRGPGADNWINLYIRHNSLILWVRNLKNILNVEVYAGRCNDQGILVELKEHVPLRTNFTLTEVESAFNDARELERKARVLLSSISVFSRK